MDTPEEWPYSLLSSQGLLRYDLPTQTLCHLCFLPNSNLPPKFSWPMSWTSSGALPLFQLPPDLHGKPPAESSYLWELSLFCTLRGASSSLKEACPLEGQASHPTYTPAQVLPSWGTQTADQILWAAALWPFVVILTQRVWMWPRDQILAASYKAFCCQWSPEHTGRNFKREIFWWLKKLVTQSYSPLSQQKGTHLHKFCFQRILTPTF